MPISYHMVHYRKIQHIDDSGYDLNFENNCRAALDTIDENGVSLWQRVQDRLYIAEDTSGQQILLNKVVDLNEAVFGELCLIDHRGVQAFLEQTASQVALSDLTIAQVYELQERAAPEGSNFVRGIAYWLVIDNHFFFLKTQSLTSTNIEKYLKWLVTKIIDKSITDTITFQAEFDKSKVGDDIGDIQNVRVKGGEVPQYKASPINDMADKTSKKRVVDTYRKVADKFVQFSQAEAIAKLLFGNDRTKSLVESLGEEEYLAVEASVKVKGKRTAESKKKMNELVKSLADTTDGTILVEGKDGKISNGDAVLRTRMPFNISEEGHHLLDFYNVADQIQEVFSRYIKDGLIEMS